MGECPTDRVTLKCRSRNVDLRFGEDHGEVEVEKFANEKQQYFGKPIRIWFYGK